MRIFIKTIVTFFLLVLIIAIPIDYYLTHYFFKDWNNISQYQKDFWVLNQKDQELDIAILGTSRAFHVINPAIIKEINPKAKVVNYGTDGTSHADHYLYLYQLLQNNGLTLSVHSAVGFVPELVPC
mgnify:CR=1 FL=1